MREIIDDLITLKEDKPYLIITKDFIRDWLLENIDLLVEEINNEIN